MKRSATSALLLLAGAVQSGCAVSHPGTASLHCAETAESTIQAEDNEGVTIVARSCGDAAGTGIVSVQTYLEGRQLDTYRVPYDSLAYSLNIENNIDLNSDGTPDLSLNTGGGKGGEGTFYWVRDPESHRYRPIGDYPTLSVCGSGNGVLYSVTPGSGDTISTWTYYIFVDWALVPLLVVDVAALLDGEMLELSHSVSDRAALRSQISSQVAQGEADDYLHRICGDLVVP